MKGSVRDACLAFNHSNCLESVRYICTICVIWSDLQPFQLHSLVCQQHHHNYIQVSQNVTILNAMFKYFAVKVIAHQYISNRYVFNTYYGSSFTHCMRLQIFYWCGCVQNKFVKHNIPNILHRSTVYYMFPIVQLYVQLFVPQSINVFVCHNHFLAEGQILHNILPFYVSPKMELLITRWNYQWMSKVRKCCFC